MATLTDFFIELNANAQLLESYKANPVTVMTNYGLSAQEIEAVMSGDIDRVKALCGDSNMITYMLVSTPTD